MRQRQLLPSRTPRGGPLGYVIFLSDILGIFYDSFLEYRLFNSFPVEEFLLPLLQACVETHKTYVNKKVGPPLVLCLLSLL